MRNDGPNSGPTPPDPLDWPGSRLILATDEIIAHGTGPRPRVGFVAKISRDPGQARGSGGGQEGVRPGVRPSFLIIHLRK